MTHCRRHPQTYLLVHIRLKDLDLNAGPSTPRGLFLLLLLSPARHCVNGRLSLSRSSREKQQDSHTQARQRKNEQERCETPLSTVYGTFVIIYSQTSE